MDKEQYPADGHLYRKVGGHWTHAEELCEVCKPEETKPENLNEWTHKCSYLSHVDGKVTLTDRSQDCFLCGELSPRLRPPESWWKNEPSDEEVGVWVHRHGRQELFMPHWALGCRRCGAKQPHSDYEIKSLAEWRDQKALRSSDQVR